MTKRSDLKTSSAANGAATARSGLTTPGVGESVKAGPESHDGCWRRVSMTKLGRSMTICCLFFGVLVLVATSWAQSRPPIAEKIAKTYGLDSWGQIDAIRYTWKGEITGLFKVSRAWEWEPKTGKVSYESKD